MSKRVYISADYSEDSGDRDVVDLLNNWGKDNYHKTDFVDMAKVVSGSVSNNDDCRPCDLKKEFNSQINASSAVIIVVGDKTASRTAGSSCSRAGENSNVGISCTPYKQNRNGISRCKFLSTSPATVDVGNVNNYSFIEHEYRQAVFKNKQIYIFYNSLNNMCSWLPSYMDNSCFSAYPFWIYNSSMEKYGNYQLVKSLLDYD